MSLNRRQLLKNSIGAAAGGALMVVARRALASPSPAPSKALVPTPEPQIPEGLKEPPLKGEIIYDTLEDGWHAFYSDEAAQHHGFVVYRTADGSLVPCTAVYRSMSQGQHDYKWKDTEYRGVVESYVTGWRFDYRYFDMHDRFCHRFKKSRLSEWEVEEEFDFKPNTFVKFQPKWSYPLPCHMPSRRDREKWIVRGQVEEIMEESDWRVRKSKFDEKPDMVTYFIEKVTEIAKVGHVQDIIEV